MKSYFPPVQILVISLERSIDRRMQVEQEMQKISLPWSFLDAIDGSKLTKAPVEYKSNKVKRLQGYELTPNEIGCYLSHKKAWQRCIESGIPTLVLEDDFVLSIVNTYSRTSYYGSAICTYVLGRKVERGDYYQRGGHDKEVSSDAILKDLGFKTGSGSGNRHVFHWQVNYNIEDFPGIRA